MNEITEFLNRLDSFISVAYVNELEFFNHFEPKRGGDYDLLDVSMSKERVRYTFLMSDGTTVVNSKPTMDYINWCNTMALVNWVRVGSE